MLYSKIKALPKFWKIYITVISVFIVLTCIFFIVLTVLMKNYEIKVTQEKAQKQTEISQTSEMSQSEIENEKELLSAKQLTDRKKLSNTVLSAQNNGLKHVENALKFYPEYALKLLVNELNDKGASVINELTTSAGVKYDDTNAAAKYLEAAEGEYSYEKIDDTNYVLKKGSVLSDVTLTKKPDGYYAVSNVTVRTSVSKIKIIAPSSAVVFINGIELSEKPQTAMPKAPEGLELKYPLYEMSTYVINGLINVPEVEAEIDGKKCILTSYGTTYDFSLPNTEEYKNMLFDRVCAVSYAYSDYVAGAFKFGSMESKMYPGTKFYTDLKSFDNRWYYNFEKIENINAKITRFAILSDGLICAHIEFDQKLMSLSGSVYRTVPIKLDVYLAAKGDINDPSDWLLALVE